WRRSTSGTAGLLSPQHRRGTRCVFAGGSRRAVAPEAVLVECLGLAPQVVDSPGQSRCQDAQGLALAALPGLLLLPAPRPPTATEEQTGRLAEGPAQLRVADLLAATADHLAVGLVRGADQPGVGQQLPRVGETPDVVDLVKQDEGQDRADPGDRPQAVVG